MYTIGLKISPQIKSFIVIDEFQEVADLSDGRFSDASYIAQAREYQGIFLASTQSMSALLAKGRTPGAVEAFVSNCNQRILFYSDDPLTQEMASRYDPDIDLKALGSGEALVVRYEQASRKHYYGEERCQTAFESSHNTPSKAGGLICEPLKAA